MGCQLTGSSQDNMDHPLSTPGCPQVANASGSTIRALPKQDCYCCYRCCQRLWGAGSERSHREHRCGRPPGSVTHLTGRNSKPGAGKASPSLLTFSSFKCAQWVAPTPHPQLGPPGSLEMGSGAVSISTRSRVEWAELLCRVLQGPALWRPVSTHRRGGSSLTWTGS